MTGLRPYLDLTPRQREAIHAWLTDHAIDYTRVPIHAQLEHDPATNEWRIPMFVPGEQGGVRLNADRTDVLRIVVRRRELRPLPWPAAERRRLIGLDLLTAATPSLLLVAGIFYTAWCNWWI